MLRFYCTGTLMTFVSFGSIIAIDHQLQRKKEPLTYKDFIDPFILAISWPISVPFLAYTMYQKRKKI